VTIHLVTNEELGPEIEAIQYVVADANAELKVTKVSNFDRHNWKISAYWNDTNYLRLMIPDLIHEDKVLYLDSDLIVTRDLIDLYETTFDGALIIGALEHLHLAARAKIPTYPDEPYINTGMMLMDLNALRSANFFEKCIEIHLHYKDLIIAMDQCVINKFAEGKKKIVGNQWNRLILAHMFNRTKFEKSIEGNTAIVHFAGPIKPWMEWSNAYLTEFWLEYATKTPLKEILIEKISSYEQALYKILNLDEDQDFEASGQLKNRLINSMDRPKLTKHNALSAEAQMVRNSYTKQKSGDTRPTFSELIDAIFNQPR
jgi:lipopolysaccharide biosynthesis glycosyltransferase